jgi:hypothetical protein
MSEAMISEFDHGLLASPALGLHEICGRTHFMMLVANPKWAESGEASRDPFSLKSPAFEQ